VKSLETLILILKEAMSALFPLVEIMAFRNSKATVA